MDRPERRGITAVLGGLWLSGVLWWILDQWFREPGTFGDAPHPFAAPLLLGHGITAVVAMYLLGWVTARHMRVWWPRRSRRLSGATFAVALGSLAVSGFALMFLSDEHWQAMAARAHTILGLLCSLCGLQHGLRVRHRDMRSAASLPW